ncbi:hypothetical protein SCP_1200560 [Sparassis crispa]|uniref:Mid2 domain-containing protein n=1 Tax=Sparassis crispa TaxID=139825 RepID=A0A401H091_9APHY|nr:hypothetical protein SCP_1200560 [Sparassis crispa]GBE87831.1 hypothetical protein SCP_1200560 [Sparassis crispa]
MPRSLVVTRRRLFVALAAALVFLPFVSGHDFQNLHAGNARAIARRQLSFPFPNPVGPTSSSDSATTASHSSGTSSATSSTPSSASATSAASSQVTTSEGHSSSSDTASSAASSATSSAPTSTPTSSTPSASASASSESTSSSSPTAITTQVATRVSTNADGEVSTLVYTVTASGSSSSASASHTSGSGSSGGSSGVSTSTIIGLSVAGGVALIGLVAFVLWKIGRKRFSNDFEDGDAIKWPELNAHGESPHALPTQRTAGAGFETSSEVNLIRPESRSGSFAASTEMYPGQNDPYAVPPLPHLNPNSGTPYHDDSGAGYYDPYNGPVPQTIEGEAIPMTQIAARSRSPMPGVMDGRRSPGPQAAFGYDAGRAPSPVLGPATGLGIPPQPARARSPGPGGTYSGRASPGPQSAYGAPPSYGP